MDGNACNYGYYAKLALGIGFACATGLYSYYTFYVSAYENNGKYSRYIEEYLGKINEMIGEKKEMINEETLCHMNHIKNEIVQEIITRRFPNLHSKRREVILDKEEYTRQLNEYIAIVESSIKAEAIKYIIDYLDIGNDKVDYRPFIKDELINLPHNKHFNKLLPYDLTNVIDGALPIGNATSIDDSFFYASVNQIEYDRILSKYYDESSNEMNSLLINELKLFKYKFKDDFYIKYNYDCKYLPELNKSVNGSKADNLNLLINKIIY